MLDDKRDYYAHLHSYRLRCKGKKPSNRMDYDLGEPPKLPPEITWDLFSRAISILCACTTSPSYTPEQQMQKADLYHQYIADWKPHISPDEGGTKGYKDG